MYVTVAEFIAREHINNIPMKKTVILPGMWGKVNSDKIDEEQMSYGIVTHRPGYKKVLFSGAVHPEGDIKEQTRGILAQKQRALGEHGGSFDDVTVLRMFVRESVLSHETQVRINEARAEFFDRPHYPVATMVGVNELLHEDALIEMEIEAEIPDDGWETEAITDE